MCVATYESRLCVFGQEGLIQNKFKHNCKGWFKTTSIIFVTWLTCKYPGKIFKSFFIEQAPKGSKFSEKLVFYIQDFTCTWFLLTPDLGLALANII